MIRLKGKCRRCGACCRNIIFMINDKYVTELEEFKQLKAFDNEYNNFYVSGADEEGILLFTCASLGEDNLCKAYLFRSIYCRLYPWIRRKAIKLGAQMLEGCGYSF